MEWVDKSDKGSKFFVGKSDAATDDTSLTRVFASLLTFLTATLSNSWSGRLGAILFEVNCDTGRILVALSAGQPITRECLDGCSLRMQKLQDFWYDLDESGVNGSGFSSRVSDEVKRIGHIFCNVVRARRAELLSMSARGSISVIVYGSVQGEILLHQEFVSV